MALNQNLILKYIHASNFQGLQNHLAKNIEEDNLILSSSFIVAFEKFINSESKTITNSYKILELLYENFISPANEARYERISPDYIDIKRLFNIYEKIKFNLQYTDSERQSFDDYEFNVDTFKEKVKFFQERQTARIIYKVADEIVEKDLIYKIKYPKNTNFIRRLLRIPPKRQPDEIIEDFTKGLPDLISSLRIRIEDDPRLRDSSGKLVLTQAEINSIIYERISLKATKQLPLDQETIDKVFTDLNTKKVSEIIDSINRKSSSLKTLNKTVELTNIIENQVPPHLINFSLINIDIRKKSWNELFGNNNKLYIEYQNKFSSTIKLHLKNLLETIEYYKDKPGRELLLEQALKNLLSYNGQLLQNQVYGSFTLDDKQIKHYKKLLSSTQKELNQKFKEENSKHKQHSKLDNYERRGIKLLSQATKTSPPYNENDITQQDKDFLESFLAYAIGNKEFNDRLSKVLKSKSGFSVQYKKELSLLHAFSYKTQNLNNIQHSLEKIENILNKLKENKDYKFTDEEKITFFEMGKVEKILSLGKVVKLIKRLNIDPQSDKIQSFLNVYEEAGILLDLGTLLRRNRTYASGDLVMDIAKRVREYYDSKLDYSDRARDFMSKYLHAAISHKVGNKTFLSHVNVIYSKDMEDISSILSDNFRIFPDKLIKNTTAKEAIKNALGITGDEELKDSLQNMFSAISTNLHNIFGKQNIDLEFDYKRGVRAFVGDALPLGYGHTGHKNIKEWAQKILKEKDNIGELIREDDSNSIICSEFAAKMTVLCLVELENQIIDKIKKKNPDFQTPEGGLLKLPFYKYEDLSKVHPGRLIKELSKHGAIEKLPEPEIVQNIIRTR